MIEIKNLGKRFGGAWVFKNLSLTIAEKESVVIIGPSGSGKSVLLKLVAGLLDPDEGSLRVESSELGMLFQKNALFDSLTVEENLLFPLKERRGIEGDEARRRARQLLEAVGLDKSAGLLPDEISGGMQKRLGIARALIVEPQVILYDEPTAGLDPVTSRIIAELILDLRRKTGTTLLTVTNDVHRAYQLGDRVGLLAQGRLTDPAPPEDIRNSTDPAIRQFVRGLREGPLSGGQSSLDVDTAGESL